MQVVKRLFRARDSVGLDSYREGWTYGNNLYYSIPLLTAEKLESVASSLRVKSKFSAIDYRQGFKLGYRSAAKNNGNQLPEEQLVKEDETMGKLATATQQVSGSERFVQASFLSDIGAVFCIKSISSHVGNFGPQWDIEIEADFGEETSPYRTLTFQKSKATPNSRDKVLAQLENATPVHNVIIVALPLKNGSTYYDLAEVGDEYTICVCGSNDRLDRESTPSPVDNDPLGDIDEHPF